MSKFEIKDLTWMSEEQAKRTLAVLNGETRNQFTVEDIQHIIDSLPF